MSRIDLPYEDWGLLLTPRFSGLGSPWQELSLALLVLIPVALLLWLYRYELRLVRRTAAVALLSLRLLLIVLLWFVISWQPILARSEVEEVPSRVVIAVDFSTSMDITDPQRTNLEKLLLARALKIQPDNKLPVADLLDSWIKQYQQEGEESLPGWIAGKGGSVKEQQALHDQICAEVDKLKRSDIAQKVLSPEGLDLYHRLLKNHQVDLIGFDQAAWDLKEKSTKNASLGGEKFTDLNQPLLRALEGTSQAKGKLLGLLLFTDGRHNSGEDPEPKAREYKARQIPIYPVAIGSKKDPADIALVRVTAPANLLQKTPSQLSAEVKVTGLPEQDLVVELHQEGEAKPKTQIIKHTGGEKKSYKVEFPLQLDQVGTHPFTLKVKPAQGKIKEISEANNSETVVVRVVEDKARVLIIDGEARWENHYLAKALLRDEAMKVDQVLFVQPNIGAIAKPLLKDAGHAEQALPKWDKDKKEADPLLQYHCIILGDVLPEQLPSEDRTRLANFVSERGGTLVLLAGKQAMPLGYLGSQGDKQELDPIAKMLPVQNLKVIKPADGFAVTLTSLGSNAPYLQMDDNPAQSTKVWAKLPSHFWGLIGKAKPGATALAYVKKEQIGSIIDSKEEKENPERDNALMVMHNYGFGRVIYLGLDSTWRWRFRKGDLYHHRFWGQLILWATSDQLLPAGNKYVRYGTKQTVYKNEEPVEIFVRLEEAAPQLSPKAKVQARILLQKEKGKEDVFAVVPLKQEGAGMRMFKGLLAKAPAGTYRIELDIPEMADKLTSSPEEKEQRRDMFVMLPTESKELAQLGVNWQLLQNLATQSGNEKGVLTVDQLEEVVSKFNSQVIAREHHEERKPWQDEPLTWYLLGIFLTLLTAEWVIRKLAALP